MNTALKDRLNFYHKFKEWYFCIIEELGYNLLKDYEARDVLSQILENRKPNWNIEKILKSFENALQSKAGVIIYGCGPSLESSVEILLRRNGRQFFTKFNNIAADGASIFLKKEKIPILSIFTDLDGITKREFDTSYIVIHAHGDNIEMLRYFENNILTHRNVIGTTQVEPIFNVINPGGFTDGDRILYFIRNLLLPEQTIYFIGMDFLRIIGKFSKPYMKKNKEGSQMKIKKLQIALKLIEWINDEVENQMYFVNTELNSNIIKCISIEEFERISTQREVSKF